MQQQHKALKPWELNGTATTEDEPEAALLELKLLRHQKSFVDDTTTREIALVGGF
jgi:hypothetical protein